MPWGFNDWFVICTIVLSLLTYYMIFYFHRFDVAVWLLSCGFFCLSLKAGSKGMILNSGRRRFLDSKHEKGVKKVE